MVGAAVVCICARKRTPVPGAVLGTQEIEGENPICSVWQYDANQRWAAGRFSTFAGGYEGRQWETAGTCAAGAVWEARCQDVCVCAISVLRLRITGATSCLCLAAVRCAMLHVLVCSRVIFNAKLDAAADDDCRLGLLCFT